MTTDLDLERLLLRYGCIASSGEFQSLRDKADQIFELVLESHDIHAAVLSELAQRSDGMLFSYYAISIALRFGSAAPYAWAAWSGGLRRAEMFAESKAISVAALELCPRSPEILTEVCRALCRERQFPAAKRYMDLAVCAQPEFLRFFEAEEDFVNLQEWIRSNGSDSKLDPKSYE